MQIISLGYCHNLSVFSQQRTIKKMHARYGNYSPLEKSCNFREGRLEAATLINEYTICIILFHSNNAKTSIIGSCPKIFCGRLNFEPEGVE